MTEHLTRTRKGHVPFGYEVSEDDPQLLLPIPAQLDLLAKALELLDQRCKLREVTRWLSAHSKRSISPQGLKNIYTNHKKKRAPKK